MKILLFLTLFVGLQGAEVCYPPCGCFSDEPPHDDVFQPESPQDQRLVWVLYTQDNPTQGVDIDIDYDAEEIILPPGFDHSKKAKFMVHGWNANPNSVTILKDAYIAAGYDYNLIAVDWRRGSFKPTYFPAAANARVAGACSGWVASQIADLNDVHCLGHSLGAHVCGYMGDSLEGNMAHATGLDPAGPGFFSNDSRTRLDKEDAQFVDTINTNSLGIAGLGLGEPVGHIDFYPHKGGRQPGCDSGSCDHSICRNYYAASISAPVDCTAVKCESEEDADSGLCDSCVGDGCNRMGYHVDKDNEGTYYTTMLAAHPYCKD